MKIATMILALCLLSVSFVYALEPPAPIMNASAKSANENSSKQQKGSQESLHVNEKINHSENTETDSKRKEKDNSNNSPDYSFSDILAFVSIILSVIAIFVTVILFKKTNETVRVQERAYVYEIGQFGKDGVFYSRIMNYGRTPAYVSDAWVEISEKSSLPEPINMDRDNHYGHYIAPDHWNTLKRESINLYGFTIPVIYGRIQYSDIFEKKHFSSFVYGVAEDGSLIPIDNTYPEYTECT